MLLFALISAAVLGATAQSPILIIHGITSSQLEARVTSDRFNCLCCTNGMYRRVWVDQDFQSSQAQCLLNDLMLLYNSTAGTYSNNTGVEVRVPGFGDTNTVEFLDTPPASPVFIAFVNYFVARRYERGNTIRAAPYDWRLAADELYRIGYYSRVQSLIETMYNSSGGEKVTLVVHSMGGIVSLYFLNEVVSQQWKDRYINAWVTLSAAWSGGNSVIEQMIFSDLTLLFRTLESGVWLLPKPSVWGNTTLVTSPSRTYTANDYEDLFTDIGYPQGYQMYLGIVPINENYPAPGVPTYCYYGTNVSTPESYTYSNGFGRNATNTVYGDGDGSVNLLSSEVCLKWKNEQSEPFTAETFPGIDHGQMVADTTVLQAVANIVGAPMPSSTTVSAAASLTLMVGSTAVLLAFLFE